MRQGPEERHVLVENTQIRHRLHKGHRNKEEHNHGARDGIAEQCP